MNESSEAGMEKERPCKKQVWNLVAYGAHNGGSPVEEVIAIRS